MRLAYTQPELNLLMFVFVSTRPVLYPGCQKFIRFRIGLKDIGNKNKYLLYQSVWLK